MPGPRLRAGGDSAKPAARRHMLLLELGRGIGALLQQSLEPPRLNLANPGGRSVLGDHLAGDHLLLDRQDPFSVENGVHYGTGGDIRGASDERSH